MAASEAEKAFYVLEYARIQSTVTVQHSSRPRFGKDSPVGKAVV